MEGGGNVVAYLAMMVMLLLFMVIGKLITKKLANPICVINFVYFVWMILGRSGYLGQFKPTYESSFFIQMNILLLDIFILVGMNIKKVFRFPFKIKVNSDVVFNWIRRISFLISIAVFFKLLIGLLTGALLLSNVRNISYSVAFGTVDYAQIYYNSVVYYIYQYLVRGFSFFDLTFCLAKMLKNEEKIPKLTILNFVLFIIIMQSRIEFMKMILFIIIFIIFSDIKFSNYQKKIMKRVVVVLGISVAVLFSFRTINTEKSVFLNTFDSFIVDFSGSNYMFSQYYNQYCQGMRLLDSPLILKYLGGLGLVIEYFFRFFGIIYDHSIVNNYLGMGHYIGSSDHYNAFYTLYFEFMNAGGIIGCLIFSIIFGIIIGKFYRNMLNNCSLKNTYTAAFVTYVMAMGTYNYVISGIYALMIITCLVIARDETAITENYIRT